MISRAPIRADQDVQFAICKPASDRHCSKDSWPVLESAQESAASSTAELPVEAIEGALQSEASETLASDMLGSLAAEEAEDTDEVEDADEEEDASEWPSAMTLMVGAKYPAVASPAILAMAPRRETLVSSS